MKSEKTSQAAAKENDTGETGHAASRQSDGKTPKPQNVTGSLIRWAVILLVLILVFFWKRETISGAFREMKNIPLRCNLICGALSILYFVFEGGVITVAARDGGQTISLWRGICCAFYCAFYKLVTLGSASGVAEIYYLSQENIPVSRSTGVTLIQYTFQKIIVTMLGILGFAVLYMAGYGGIIDYARYIAIAGLLSAVVVLALIAIAVSGRFTGLLGRMVARLMKKNPQRRDALIGHIQDFHAAGREMWRDKGKLLFGLLFNVLKLCCWYAIPAVVFASSSGADLLYCLCTMAVVNMIAGILAAPAGVGTLEYVFSLFYAKSYGVLAATAIILYRFFTMIFPCFIGAAAVVVHTRRVRG